MIVISSCSWLWPIHWSQVLSWEWRCSWSSADRRCSNYIWVINNFIANSDATYIRGLTVYRITDNTMQYNRYHKRWDHRPISQIPQCIKYSTMHHFVTEMCTHVYISVTKCCIVGKMGLVHCGICATGLLTLGSCLYSLSIPYILMTRLLQGCQPLKYYFRILLKKFPYFE